MTTGLSLDGTWPGLNVPDDGFDIDPDTLEEVADELEREANTLRSATAPGSVNKLASDAGLMPGSFGMWGTGVEMETGYQEAHSWVVHYYGEMIGALDNAIQMLRTNAAQHRQGDELSGTGMGTQQAALDNSGAAGPPPVVA